MALSRKTSWALDLTGLMGTCAIDDVCATSFVLTGIHANIDTCHALSKRIVTQFSSPSAQSVAEYIKHIGTRTKTVS